MTKINIFLKIVHMLNIAVCCRTFRYVPQLPLSHGRLCTDLFDGYVFNIIIAKTDTSKQNAG